MRPPATEPAHDKSRAYPIRPLTDIYTEPAFNMIADGTFFLQEARAEQRSCQPSRQAAGRRRD